MKKGYFITFEGPEGAGKSTIISLINKHLEQKGMATTLTREPGGIEIAEKIRSVILDKNHTVMDGRTEALLYAAARRQHLVEKIIPSLNNGKVVLCDRFIDSSLAYQGFARGLGMEEVYSINKFAIDEYMPDLTIYLDVSPQVGIDRINKDVNREINRIDLETIDFHNRVREGYMRLVKKYKNRIILINAEQNQSSVLTEVTKLIDAKLN
ncbi:dTMP kinase [Bacillus sp. Marseille-P3661]|uniref:dTMP kinase n=1 Tax=Bacillus sp. Marseille-P3661 TaxID=1936234 RepID=UPI000C8676FC|nr:dTMP kinase [Bacillus sp. Marseille-P3661]